MRRGLFIILAAAALVFGLASPAYGDPTLLYVQAGYNVEYHAGNDTAWCNRLDALFGTSDITVVNTYTNDLGAILNYDSVFLSVGGFNRDYHPERPDHLTPAQQANIAAFLATGRRMVLLGDWCSPNYTNWRNWDTSVLDAIGGAIDDGPDFQPYGFSPTPSTRTPTTPSGNTGTAELVAGVSAVVPALSGGVLGGTQVFQVHIMSLFGPQKNVLYAADGDVFTDTYLFLTPDGSNLAFIRNAATWLWDPNATSTVREDALESPGATPRLTAWPLPYRGGTLHVSLTRSATAPTAAGRTEVGLYDLSGRLVTMLARLAPDDRHPVLTWGGRDATGGEVGSGVYFLRATGPEREARLKLTVLR